LKNNRIYALDGSFEIFHKFKKTVIKSIANCLDRDQIKNSQIILFDDLKDHVNSYIYYSKFKYSNFKYQYLLNDLYLTKISDLTEKQINILKYIIKNFGLHFYICENIQIINKNDFTMSFIINNQNCKIYDISLFEYENYDNLEDFKQLIKPKYKKYKEFDYYYTYKNDTICGVTKEEIKNECFNKYNINIDINDIKKNYSTLGLDHVKTQEDIEKIKHILKNQENIKIFDYNKKSKILGIKKINMVNPITFDYILDLTEKTQKCRYCNEKISINKKESKLVSIDAIDPLLGHTIGNIDMICGDCNLFKGTKYM